MKKFLWILAAVFSAIWIVALALLVSTDLKILEVEEQQKLKENKLFWQWPSVHGNLAMHFVEKGEGDKHLLLIHGFRSHTYTWRHLIDPLAEAGYHVWSIDLIGFGLSDKPDDVPYNFNFFIEQIKSFMDAKGIVQPHLIGNSMGGALALKMAILYPDQVQSLTLLNALGYPLDLPLYLSVARHFDQIWAPFLGPTMVRSVLKQIVFDHQAISDEQVEAYSLPYRFPGGVMASLLTLRQFDKQHLIDLTQQYGALSHPMLVIWGDQDTLIPVTHYEKFLKDFPHAHCLLITNCGHIPQEEEPQQVLSALLQFFHTIEPHPSIN